MSRVQTSKFSQVAAFWKQNGSLGSRIGPLKEVIDLNRWFCRFECQMELVLNVPLCDYLQNGTKTLLIMVLVYLDITVEHRFVREQEVR